MSQNPYETHYSNLASPGQDAAGLDLDDKETMLSMARWQMFFAILGVIGCSLICLVMLAQMGALMFNAGNGTRVVTAMGASVFMMVIMGLFYVLPTIRLFQATSAIRKFANEGAPLSKVLQTQRSFWRTIGVIAAVGIALYVIIIFVAIVGSIGFRF